MSTAPTFPLHGKTRDGADIRLALLLTPAMADLWAKILHGEAQEVDVAEYIVSAPEALHTVIDARLCKQSAVPYPVVRLMVRRKGFSERSEITPVMGGAFSITPLGMVEGDNPDGLSLLLSRGALPDHGPLAGILLQSAAQARRRDCIEVMDDFGHRMQSQSKWTPRLDAETAAFIESIYRERDLRATLNCSVAANRKCRL